MDLTKLLDDLMAMSRPQKQDQRLDDYCNYVNMAVSQFGQERCMVVGSTKEETRLRTYKDGGDWDILVIGEVTIPVECLEYRKDLPCFVHINGTFLKDLEKKYLIDGKFLPAGLVKRASPLFFSRLKGILDFCCRPQSFLFDGESRVAMDSDIKPGITVTGYTKWYSDLLNPRVIPVSACDKALTKKIVKRMKESEVFEDRSNGIADFLQNLARLAHACRKDKLSESHFYQLFGRIFTGFAVDQMEPTERNGAENESVPSEADDMNKARSNRNEGSIREERTEIHSATLGSTDRLSTAQYERLPFIQIPAGPKSVRVTYAQKSMKDFIPALRLSAPPVFINKWTSRDRYWPNPHTVGVISRGQFFVVAKPAVKDEQPEKDFCLSCNLAEIILAKAMPPGHKKCLLMVKAFQKSILQGFSNLLTTFHWKTALYWMLESTDPDTYSENSEDILNVLRDLLDYMRDRLHEGYLQHYFFPSNLFAGVEEGVRAEIVKKIEEIYLDPTWYLNAFLLQESQEHEANEINVSLGKMMVMKKKTEREQDQFFAGTLLDTLEAFGRPSSSSRPEAAEKFPDFMLKIIESMLLDERMRQDNEHETTSSEEKHRLLKDKIMPNIAAILFSKETSTPKRTQELLESIDSYLSSEYNN